MCSAPQKVELLGAEHSILWLSHRQDAVCACKEWTITHSSGPVPAAGLIRTADILVLLAMLQA